MRYGEWRNSFAMERRIAAYGSKTYLRSNKWWNDIPFWKSLQTHRQPTGHNNIRRSSILDSNTFVWQFRMKWNKTKREEVKRKSHSNTTATIWVELAPFLCRRRTHLFLIHKVIFDDISFCLEMNVKVTVAAAMIIITRMISLE